MSCVLISIGQRWGLSIVTNLLLCSCVKILLGLEIQSWVNILYAKLCVGTHFYFHFNIWELLQDFYYHFQTWYFEKSNLSSRNLIRLMKPSLGHHPLELFAILKKSQLSIHSFFHISTTEMLSLPVFFCQVKFWAKQMSIQGSVI